MKSINLTRFRDYRASMNCITRDSRSKIAIYSVLRILGGDKVGRFQTSIIPRYYRLPHVWSSLLILTNKKLYERDKYN